MHLQGDNPDDLAGRDILAIGMGTQKIEMDRSASERDPPQRERTRVVFPDPFGPKMAQCSSDRTFQKLSSNMSRLGRRTVI